MFWLLVGMVLAVALVMLLRPLLQPSPLTTTHVSAAVALAISLPAAAVLGYLQLGSPPSAANDGPQQNTLPPVEDMLDELRKRLAGQPDDLPGWLLLIDSLVSIGRYSEAMQTVTELNPRFPDATELQLRHAEVVAILADGSLIGEPTTLVQRVLIAQPDHPRGLWLAAIAAEERGDSDEALAYWQRLLPQLQDEAREQVQTQINRLSNTPN